MLGYVSALAVVNPTQPLIRRSIMRMMKRVANRKGNLTLLLKRPLCLNRGWGEGGFQLDQQEIGNGRTVYSATDG